MGLKRLRFTHRLKYIRASSSRAQGLYIRIFICMDNKRPLVNFGLIKKNKWLMPAGRTITRAYIRIDYSNYYCSFK